MLLLLVLGMLEVLVLLVVEEMVVLVIGIFERGIYSFRIVMAPQALACRVFEVCGCRREGNIQLGSNLS